MRCTASLVLLAAAACGPAPDVPRIDREERPVARMAWPQLWPVARPVVVDGSGSFDPDGTVTSVTAVFGDGTPEQRVAGGVFEHLYAAPGSYQVELTVVDDRAGRARVSGDVVVVERADDPLCSCALPCFEPAVCTAGGCILQASSAPDEAPPALPDVVTCP